MTPEGQPPSELNNILTVTAIIGGIYLLSQFAFSRKTAREIGTRAKWKSEISGKSFWDGWVLHMAHLIHTRDDTYDDPERGIAVTVPEHLKMHEDYRGRAEDIGLQEYQNEYAIRMLKKTPIYNKYRK